MICFLVLGDWIGEVIRGEDFVQAVMASLGWRGKILFSYLMWTMVVFGLGDRL